VKTLDLLRSLGDRAGHLDNLRLVSTTLATDVARGVSGDEMAAMTRELAWIDPVADARGYLQALRDWTLAWEREREVVRRDQALAAAIQKPGWREVMEHLRDQPRTATQLAETITSSSMPTIHRWLGRLEELGLVASEEVGNTRPCWLTPRGLFALEDVARPQDAGAAAIQLGREALLHAASRPVQHLGLRPIDRTLSWSLSYWVVELIEHPTWTAADAAVAADLTRFLTELSQPWSDAARAGGAAGSAAGSARDASRELLSALWTYRGLSSLVDRDLSFERRFAALRPAADHPGRLAWAIAAIRVAHSVGERSHDPALVDELRDGARAVLTGLDVPLALFWRNDLGAAPADHELVAALTSVPLGIGDEHVAIVRNLECCRVHLGFVADTNQQWTSVMHELAELGQSTAHAFPYVRWDDAEESAHWIEDNRDRATAWLRESITPDLVDAARRWLDRVSRAPVPTAQRDRNLTWDSHVCRAVLRLGSAGEPGVAAAEVAAMPEEIALRQVEQLDDAQQATMKYALVRCAA
jgi:DNA-binding transcriptional ArsR family regulator